MDGWDDDDLDLGLDDDDEQQIDTNAVARTIPASPTSPGGGAGGWDDDDDLFGEEDEAPIVATAPAVAPAGDGWDEDDEDLNFDDEEDNVDKPEAPPAASATSELDDNAFGASFRLPVTQSVPVTTLPPPTSPEKNDSYGWADDEDLNFDDDDDDEGVPTPSINTAPADAFPPAAAVDPSPPILTASNPPAVLSSQGNEDGWSDEEDDLNFDEDDNEHASGADPTQTIPPEPAGPDVRQQLQDYVESLGRMASSVNAVLEFEYNTPEKAQELVEYYTNRPGLAEYTRTKELPRMNYQVVLPGKVETSKEVIAQHYLPDDSLLARCANQSLLADLIQVLTGPDLVVRPQFFAVCVAQTCQFRLHVGDEGRDMVQCNCILQLSLPKEEGPRLNVATLRTTVVFSPHQHSVRFKVDKIIVMLKDMSKLDDVVPFLNMMRMENLGPPPADEYQQPHTAAANDQFRDVFLMNAQEHTQKLVHQSKAGMQSALKDMESVLGLTSKFKAVQGGISKFLPTSDDLMAVEEEARALAVQREQAQQRQTLSQPVVPSPTGPPTEGTFPRPPAGPSMEGAFPRPPPQPVHLQQQPAPPLGQHPPPPMATGAAGRPKSILGGLVSTGWSALAKRVALPDENPDIYGGHNAAPPPQSQQPLLYRRDGGLPPPSQPEGLFPRPADGPMQQPVAPQPKREAMVPTSPPMQQQPPQAVPTETTEPPQDQPLAESQEAEEEPDDFGDGWDDDIDLDITADDANVANIHNEGASPVEVEQSASANTMVASMSTTVQGEDQPTPADSKAGNKSGETESSSSSANTSASEVQEPATENEYDWGATEESETTGGAYDWNAKVEGDDTENNGDYDWGEMDEQIDESETNAGSDTERPAPTEASETNEETPVDAAGNSGFEDDTEIVIPETNSEGEDASPQEVHGVRATETRKHSPTDMITNEYHSSQRSQPAASAVSEVTKEVEEGTLAPRRPIVVDMPYDAATDIIPTRKRWRNPRPNRPYLVF